MSSGTQSSFPLFAGEQSSKWSEKAATGSPAKAPLLKRTHTAANTSLASAMQVQLDNAPQAKETVKTFVRFKKRSTKGKLLAKLLEAISRRGPVITGHSTGTTWKIAHHAPGQWTCESTTVSPELESLIELFKKEEAVSMLSGIQMAEPGLMDILGKKP